MEATELFELTLRWLRSRYSDFRFFTERDVVWTFQKQLLTAIEEAGLAYRVFNDHTIRHRRRVDLAILDGDSVIVAAEFKYEPSRNRRAEFGGDIWDTKFPVTSWTGDGSVDRDVRRIRDFVEHCGVMVAYSIFIDEGGHFRHRDPHPSSQWMDWDRGVCVLVSRSLGEAG